MKDKQKLIEILKQLEWNRDLARWFLLIVEKTEDEKLIDEIIKLIKRWIRTIKNNRIRTKLIERVKELQRKWDLDQETSNEEADSRLDDFINGVEE